MFGGRKSSSYAKIVLSGALVDCLMFCKVPAMTLRRRKEKSLRPNLLSRSLISPDNALSFHDGKAQKEERESLWISLLMMNCRAVDGASFVSESGRRNCRFEKSCLVPKIKICSYAQIFATLAAVTIRCLFMFVSGYHKSPTTINVNVFFVETSSLIIMRR